LFYVLLLFCEPAQQGWDLGWPQTKSSRAYRPCCSRFSWEWLRNDKQVAGIDIRVDFNNGMVTS